jgi:glycolate oxidase iron-sulfur subunit
MQTRLPEAFRASPAGQEAERILRSCVHCGFCLATCPSYQIIGDEQDSPRGRIYLMKQMFEGATVSRETLTHLDRCLTCRNCETTCPSGVEYAKLVDLGRAEAEARVSRPLGQRLLRRALGATLSRPRLFATLLGAGRLLRPVLPGALQAKIPARPAKAIPATANPAARRMLVLEGCVQPALAPQINQAARQVLGRLGIQLVSADGCCGAVRFHLNQQDAARTQMRRNLLDWQAELDNGCEAIVSTASGCGVTIKDYAHTFKDDPDWAAPAARLANLTHDIAEIVLAEHASLDRLLAARRPPDGPPQTVAWHAPCTLQHGQKLTGIVEALLTRAGYRVAVPQEAHLCCGSAGTYSLLEPDTANALRSRKLGHLQAVQPDIIASANIGCLSHLQAGTPTPVRHWIELIAARLAEPAATPPRET